MRHYWKNFYATELYFPFSPVLYAEVLAQDYAMLKNKTLKDVYINTANGMKRDEESNNIEREGSCLNLKCTIPEMS